MNNSTGDRRSPLGLFPRQPTPKLYDRVVEVLRTRHYSRRAEEAYLHWIRRFLLFHPGAQPRELAENDLNRFLTHDGLHARFESWRSRGRLRKAPSTDSGGIIPTDRPA